MTPSAEAAPSLDASLPLQDQFGDAFRDRDEALMIAIVEAGLDPNADLGAGVTPLHRAAAAGFATVVQALIDAGADVNARAEDRNTPLSLAAINGDGATVTALVNAGADTGARPGAQYGQHAIHDAAFAGNLEALVALLDAGGDVDVLEDTASPPIMYAAYNGHADVVAELIRRGADVNLRDQGGFSSLEWAENRGHAEIAAALRAAGATE